MPKIAFVFIFFIALNGHAQYDTAIVNRVFAYVVTDKFRREYVDTFDAQYERYKKLVAGVSADKSVTFLRRSATFYN